MADHTNLRARLGDLKKLREELVMIQKEAFMPAPPMPGGGGGAPPPPGMDPAMMQGGMPPGMDPSMMQQGGAPPMDPAMMQGGMPPGMDPSMMQQGGGMPPGMDPAMMQQGGDPAAGGPITPEMLDELLGVLEEIAARQEAVDQKQAQQDSMVEELMAKLEDMEQRLAQAMAVQQPDPAMMQQGGGGAPAGPGGWS